MSERKPLQDMLSRATMEEFWDNFVPGKGEEHASYSSIETKGNASAFSQEQELQVVPIPPKPYPEPKGVLKSVSSWKAQFLHWHRRS